METILSFSQLQDPSSFTLMLVVFILSIFIGYFVIWQVTPALHSPLMSVTNAVSSVIIVGAIIAVSQASFVIVKIIAYAAIFLASVNIFGGFLITSRMLQMFRSKDKKKGSQ